MKFCLLALLLLAGLLALRLAAQTPAPPAAPAPTAAPAAGLHRVTLQDAGSNKIGVIMALRKFVPGLGLAEAKKLAESAPVAIKDAAPEDAARLLHALAEAGATAEATPPLPAALASADPAALAKGTHRVILQSFGESKIMSIKIVRDATHLGLAEAKHLVESAPVTVLDTDEVTAQSYVKQFEAIGAKAQVVPVTPALLAPNPAAPAKPTHRVILQSFGDEKIMSIKIVRDATHLGLADAKKLVESAPVTVLDTDEVTAQSLVKQFEAIGAKAVVEPLKK